MTFYQSIGPGKTAYTGYTQFDGFGSLWSVYAAVGDVFCDDRTRSRYPPVASDYWRWDIH